MKISRLRIAALLALVTMAVHAILGGMDTLRPLLDSDLPPMVKGTFHAVWHIITLVLGASALVFWKGGPAARPVGALWIGFAVIFAAVALVQGGISELLVLPQWTLLGATGSVALWAARHS